jgi:hypothetical protein
MILKPVPKVSNMETYLLERISKENAIKRQKSQADSVRFESEITIRDKKINRINKQRKNDLTNYQSEIAKINLITTDSAYLATLDSIKKVCCSNSSGR